jgi:hypothetical protein
MLSDGITIPKWAADGLANNSEINAMAKTEHLFAVSIFPPFWPWQENHDLLAFRHVVFRHGENHTLQDANLRGWIGLIETMDCLYADIKLLLEN